MGIFDLRRKDYSKIGKVGESKLEFGSSGAAGAEAVSLPKCKAAWVENSRIECQGNPDQCLHPERYPEGYCLASLSDCTELVAYDG
jgi:hypothetical protein